MRRNPVIEARLRDKADINIIRVELCMKGQAAFGLARDRELIIMHLGIILGADGPGLSAKSTTVSVP